MLKPDRRHRARRARSPACDASNRPAPSDGTDLFAAPPEGDPEAADPAALSRAATLASGRAMKGRLWHEARALAALAESYTRLAQRAIEALPPEDPTAPGRRAATEFLAEFAIRHIHERDAAAAEAAVDAEAEAEARAALAALDGRPPSAS